MTYKIGTPELAEKLYHLGLSPFAMDATGAPLTFSGDEMRPRDLVILQDKFRRNALYIGARVMGHPVREWEDIEKLGNYAKTEMLDDLRRQEAQALRVLAGTRQSIRDIEEELALDSEEGKEE